MKLKSWPDGKSLDLTGSNYNELQAQWTANTADFDQDFKVKHD